MKNEIVNNDALTVRVNTDAVNDALEAAQEAVETAAENVVTITKNNPYVLAGVAVVALSVGAVVGYKVAERRLQTKFDKLVIEEIDRTKDFFKRLNKEGEFSTPESAAEALGTEVDTSDPEEASAAKEAVDALKQYQGREPVNYNKVPAARDENEPEATVTVNNIFLNGKPIEESDFDYDAELAKRDPDYPYIVTQDEFFQNEPENEQSQITYYAGDDVLVDDQQAPMPDEDIVGAENLKFGHGSGDANIVYVRNQKLGLDFEICRDERKYSEHVLGFQHSDRSDRPLRLRRGDIG